MEPSSLTSAHLETVNLRHTVPREQRQAVRLRRVVEQYSLTFGKSTPSIMQTRSKEPRSLRPLPSSLRAHIRRLSSLTALERREIEALALSALQSLPKPESGPVIPHKRSNIRLHIPVQGQRRVLALRNLALDVCDLIFGLLAVELDDARAAAGRIGLAGGFL